MQEPPEAGDAWRAWALARLGIAEAEAAADVTALFDKALPLLVRPNKSGFRDVFPVVKKWQAKVYVRPKVQRNLGLYETKEEAAVQVLFYLFNGVPPPTPDKNRNKRGMGRRQKPRRQQQPRKPSLATPLAEWPAQPLTPETFAAALLRWECTPPLASKERRPGRRPWPHVLWSD